MTRPGKSRTLRGRQRPRFTTFARRGTTFVTVGSQMLETVEPTSDNGSEWKPVYMNKRTPDGSPA